MLAVTPELLAAARNYFDITWADDAGDEKLLGILSRGMKKLNHAAGVTLRYDEGTTGRQLLFDYAGYVRAGDAAAFDNDFSHELLRLHIDGEVEQAEEV